MNDYLPRRYGYNIPHTAIEECLAGKETEGEQSIEINIPHDGSLADIFNPARVESIKTLAAEKQVTLSLHVPFRVNITELIPAIRRANIQYLQSCIEIAAELGIHLITLHLGTFYWFPVAQHTRHRALERFIENIDSVLETCKKFDVRLAMENVARVPLWSEYYHLGDRIEDFQYIFERVDSEYLGFCLDTGHANISEGVSAYIQALGAHIINVHVHDNLGDDDSHLMIGEGTVPWQDVAQGFQELQYEGAFISECRWKDPIEVAKKLEGYFYNASPVKS